MELKFCTVCGKIRIKDPRISWESYLKRTHCKECHKGSNHPMWKGGRSMNGGYIEILMPKHPNSNKRGYIREHRLVMEEYIGRYLFKGEAVHHINGNKSDNRIENLQLFSSHGEHTRVAHPEVLTKMEKTRFKKGQIPWNKKIT